MKIAPNLSSIQPAESPSKKARFLSFGREDWTRLRTIEGVCQASGVSPSDLARLVIKELVDNALDAAGSVQARRAGDRTFVIRDHGAGLAGSDDEIARLFSIGRPLWSTKLLRRPTRGALGHGARVVAGAVLASGGKLELATQGRRLSLAPREDGSTEVFRLEHWDQPGTEVTITFGEVISVEGDVLDWAHRAIRLGKADSGTSRSSAYWYDEASFRELCWATEGAATVRDLVESLQGCSGAKAAKIAGDLRGKLARDLTAAEASRVLRRARRATRPVKASRLGKVGAVPDMPAGYACLEGTLRPKVATGQLQPEIPFLAEAWVEFDGIVPTIAGNINRTPIVARLGTAHHANDQQVWGAGLQECVVRTGRYPAQVTFNITSPFVPITSDGKTPDLSHFSAILVEAIAKASRKAKKLRGAFASCSDSEEIKAVFLENLDSAIDVVSGGGKLRYSLRQLYYQMRPMIEGVATRGLEYGYFTKMVTDREAAIKHDLRGLYRDERGSLYHPHTGESISLGTLMAETYERPTFTFNKGIYIEKEGVYPALIDAQFPERWDCALFTSRGFATRAVKDVLDRIEQSDEEFLLFCLHDADVEGLMIYQTLQNATKARPGRKIRVINLGLDPDEAVAMHLPVEPRDARSVPLAMGIAPDHREWLRSKRVELNAMSPPRLVKWLDEKMAKCGLGKVVPPEQVMTDHLAAETRHLVEEHVRDAILRESGFEQHVNRSLSDLSPRLDSLARSIDIDVRRALKREPTLHWAAAVDREAARVVAGWANAEA